LQTCQFSCQNTYVLFLVTPVSATLHPPIVVMSVLQRTVTLRSTSFQSDENENNDVSLFLVPWLKIAAAVSGRHWCT